MERRRSGPRLALALAALGASALAVALVLLAGCRRPAGPAAQRAAGTPQPPSSCDVAVDAAGHPDSAGAHPAGQWAGRPGAATDGPETSGAPCAPGCTANGNCNREEGRCECRWGYAGPTCAISLLPACSLGPNAAALQCSDRLPRPCACLRQCYELFCPGGGECSAPRNTWFPRCFEVVGPAEPLPHAAQGAGHVSVAADGVYSDIPDSDGAANGAGTQVLWFQGFRLDQQRRRITRQQALDVGNGTTVVPLRHCPGSCSFQGQCVAKGGRVRCACWKGYEGPGCETVQEAACLNRCQGRGTCSGGFCHCRDGFWGKDCSRSHVFQAPRPLPSAALRVYVYELPSHLAFDYQSGAAFSFEAGFPDHHPNYLAYRAFTSLLLNDRAIRTEDPWEATLFFVPAAVYAYSSNTGNAAPHLRRVMAHVAASGPFFNRSQGQDHVLWLAGDRGTCFLPPSDPLLAGPIKITHFGLTRVTHADAGLPGNDFVHLPDKEHACHRPQRDIVAAPYFERQEDLAAATYAAAAAAATAAPLSDRRPVLLFFAGNAGADDPAYSGGVRQDLFRLFGNSSHADVALVAGGMSPARYEAAMRAARYCLAPYGYGWGIRLSEAVAMGCVPVIVQDGVLQPYEEDGLLPYSDFSIRLPRSQLPGAVDALRRLPPERYAALQHGLFRHWPAFIWDPSRGGRAYDMTVAALRRRATALLGAQF